MAGYKVIQDIEAEDKLLGPLSLRQFIYALIAVVCLYFCFLLYSKGAGFLMPLFFIPAFCSGFFAVPWSKQQTTEVWALAKIRFFLKPRRRIWDQSGVKELVTVTVPKKIEHRLTNGLSQGEVHSRLEALASTLDSRGWAIKNVNVNLYSQPQANISSSDRLVDVNNLPQEVPSFALTAADDMLDEVNNPLAQQFDMMIDAQTRNHRAQIMQDMQRAAAGIPAMPTAPPMPQQPAPAPVPAAQQPAAAADYWFLNQPAQVPLQAGQAQFTPAAPIMPGMTLDEAQIVASPEEEAIAARAKASNLQTNEVVYGRLRTLRPISDQPVVQPQQVAEPAQVTPVEPPKPVTAQPDPAILELARSNDLNVDTIARQAKKAKQHDNDEVIISLR
ncbi:MAG: uncharacterized protein JWM37_219 [Candidatus Saccharibacteria bacterium]|nr:uncharacterized protein [Candidatus Saccharibacteria bacterium]